jgi:hypothetical protein
MGDVADDEDAEESRERLRRYAAANDPSPIARLQRTLNAIVQRMRASLHRDPEERRPSVSSRRSEPLPTERSSVANVMTALVNARARLERREGGQVSAKDGEAAMKVVHTLTDKVTSTTCVHVPRLHAVILSVRFTRCSP